MRRRTLQTSAVTVALLLGVAACSPRPTGSDADYEPYQPPDAQSLECAPNLDEKITSDELDPTPGVAANYLVSPAGAKRSVDLEGKTSGGTRTWDWSERRQSDQTREIAPDALDDEWFASEFPSGQFVLPVDLAGRTQGIYRKTDSRMLLLGLASREESPDNGKTLLRYDSPVVVYRFPLEKGQQWISRGDVEDGTLRGAPYAGTDIYRVNVRARGEMKLPDFTFEQVHRVDTRVTVEPAAGKSVSNRQVSFLAECFGEVARATSPDGVTKPNFDEAAEVRRLGSR